MPCQLELSRTSGQTLSLDLEACVEGWPGMVTTDLKSSVRTGEVHNYIPENRPGHMSFLMAHTCWRDDRMYFFFCYHCFRFYLAFCSKYIGAPGTNCQLACILKTGINFLILLRGWEVQDQGVSRISIRWGLLSRWWLLLPLGGRGRAEMPCGQCSSMDWQKALRVTDPRHPSTFVY